jgi:hypothetical protein
MVYLSAIQQYIVERQQAKINDLVGLWGEHRNDKKSPEQYKVYTDLEV